MRVRADPKPADGAGAADFVALPFLQVRPDQNTCRLSQFFAHDLVTEGEWWRQGVRRAGSEVLRAEGLFLPGGRRLLRDGGDGKGAEEQGVGPAGARNQSLVRQAEVERRAVRRDGLSVRKELRGKG